MCPHLNLTIPGGNKPSNEVTGLELLQLMRAGAVWGLKAGCVSGSPHPWQPQGVLLARVGAAKTACL